MASSLRRLASNSGKAYRSSLPPISRISSIFSKIPSKPLIRPVFCRALCTAVETRAQKLERIADEVLRLNQAEFKEYAALLRQKMGLKPWGAACDPGQEEPKYSVKLVDFDLVARFDVMAKLKECTNLSMDEIEDLMEKTPAVVTEG